MTKKKNNEWTVPTSWEQVTTKQYQDIQTILKENEDATIRDYLPILTNKSKKEVDELPVEAFELLLQEMTFLLQQPEVEPSASLTIDGEKYFVNVADKLKTGEFIDSQMILEKDPNNLSMLLGILCRKAGETYDDDFIANVLPARIAMFEQQPITDTLKIVGFFLQLWQHSMLHSLLYGEAEKALDQLANDIKTSQKLGRGRKFFLKRRVKALKKRLNYAKPI